MKWIKRNLAVLIATSYLAGAIFTFGHAATHYEGAGKAEVMVLGSMLWPFYWSWQLQRP